MNSFEVFYKNGDEWTLVAGKVAVPFGYANLLDERLDEAYLTIYHDTVECYKPTTEFKIIVTYGVTNIDEEGQKKEFYYILGDDQSINMPIGSKKYKHEIYLIELTKLLEGTICQSLTFTNVSIQDKRNNNAKSLGNVLLNNVRIFGIYGPVSCCYSAYARVDFPYCKEIYKSVQEKGKSIGKEFADDAYTVFEVCIKDSYQNSTTLAESFEANISVDSLSPGEYTLCYSYYSLEGLDDITVKFKFSVFDFLGKVKKITIKDCIERILTLETPLFGEEEPQYMLNRAQETELDKILAPEFSLTQCTLREQLKTVGGYIHSEPRLRYNADGKKEIFFEKYVSGEDAKISTEKYVYKAFNHSINNYCTEIRSNVQNLVNSYGDGKGTIIDPSSDSYRSLRTENIFVRLTTDNAIVETQYPIHSIEKVTCDFVKVFENGEQPSIKFKAPIDITDFIYEEANYNLLTSFSSSSNQSKECAMYFTRGQKHIRGLFYQAPHAVNSSLAEYAISNIIKNAGRSKVIYIEKDIAATLKQIDDSIVKHYYYLVFNVTYKPVYSAVITHGKNLYSPGETHYAMLYNQSENYIETDFYGEHIKGVAQRLGNIDHTRTYILKDFTIIPTPGQMLDEYVISAVEVNMFPTYIKLTVSLSKNFNRISQYVGVNSIKRSYEISETQISDRHVYIKEVLLIGESSNPEKTLFNTDSNSVLLSALKKMFGDADEQKQNKSYLMTTAYAQLSKNVRKKDPETDKVTYEKGTICTVRLPVVSSSFGNTISFTFSFKDNYSAGTHMFYYDDEKVNGAWGNETPACDSVGRAYYLDFALCSGSDIGSIVSYALIPQHAEAYIPGLAKDHGADTSATGSYILWKDNRESISITIALEIKSNREDLIIGSGFAALFPLVNNLSLSDSDSPMLYLVKKNFDVMKKSIAGLDLNEYFSTGYKVEIRSFATHPYISLAGNDVTFSESSDEIKGWVIAMPVKSGAEAVYDEIGKKTEQTIYSGGEILLRCKTPPQKYEAGTYSIYDANKCLRLGGTGDSLSLINVVKK